MLKLTGKHTASTFKPPKINEVRPACVFFISLAGSVYV